MLSCGHRYYCFWLDLQPFKRAMNTKMSYFTSPTQTQGPTRYCESNGSLGVLVNKSKSNHTVDRSQTTLNDIKTAFEACKTASASAKQ